MARKYIAFLGVSKYIPVNYMLNNSKVNNCAFIQAALAEILCKNWDEQDSIIIFLTKEAEEKNWRTPNSNNYDGLEKTLIALNLPVGKIIAEKDLPKGENEVEIWKTFENVLNRIDDNDEIYFDITHGFRSIPMLALVILSYARVVRKNVKIGGIFYGAFETLGSARDILNMPIEERDTPIFDLTSFSALLEWTAGVDRFIDTGDSSIIAELTKKNVNPILSATRGTDLNARALKKLSASMEKFGRVISTCRGPEISGYVKDLLKNLNSLTDESKALIPAFKPLFEKLENKLEKFGQGDIENGIAAVDWCIRHNLIQQGYTILQETIITDFCRKQGVNEKDRDKRTEISSDINLLEQNNRGDDTEKHPDYDLAALFVEIGNYRNDINHAGYREDASSGEKIINRLEKLFERYLKIRKNTVIL